MSDHDMKGNVPLLHQIKNEQLNIKEEEPMEMPVADVG